MALKGNLHDFKVGDILKLIATQRKSGILIFENNEDRISLEIRAGLTTNLYCERNQSDQHFLQYLVSENIISESRIDELSQLQKQSGIESHDVLLMEGSISQKDIRNFVEWKIRIFFTDLILWKKGTFHFESGAEFKNTNETKAALSIEDLMRESSAKISKIMKLKQLPSDQIPLKQAKTKNPEELKHDQSKWKIFQLLSEPQSLQDLYGISPLSRFETLKTVTELYNAGSISEGTAVSSLRFSSSGAKLNLTKDRLTEISKEFVRHLTKGIINRSLYPEKHPVLIRTVMELKSFIDTLTSRHPIFVFSHFEGRLIADNVPLPYPDDQFSAFVETLKVRDIRNLLFFQGISTEELLQFLHILRLKLDDIKSKGGIANILKDYDIKHIRVENIDAGYQVNQTGGRSVYPFDLEEEAESVAVSKPEEEGLYQKRDPQDIAGDLAAMTDLSGEVSFSEMLLQIEMLKASFERILNDNFPDDAQQFRAIFKELDPRIRRGLLFRSDRTDSSLDKHLDDYLMEITADERAEMFAEEYESLLRNVDAEDEESRKELYIRMQESLDRLSKLTEETEGSESRVELLKSVKLYLTEAGVAIRDIRNLMGKDEPENPQMAALMDRMKSADAEELLTDAFVFETRRILKDAVLEEDGAAASLVVKPYARFMDHDSWEIRQRAAEALREIADDLVAGNSMDILEEVIVKFIERFQVENVLQAYKALINSLRHIAMKLKETDHQETGDRITDFFSEQLKQRRKHSLTKRRIVAKALGEIGDEKAVSALISALEDRLILDQSVQSLLEIGEGAIEPLIEVLKKSDKQSVRWRISRILTEIGDPVVPALLKELKNEKWFVRRNSCMLLGKIGDKNIIQHLKDLMKDNHVQVRREAIVAIGNLASYDAEDILLEALEDEYGTIRRYAVFLLGNVGTEKSVDPLIKILTRRTPFFKPSEDEDLRRESCAALGRLLSRPEFNSPDHNPRGKAVPILGKVAKETSSFSKSKKINVSVSAIQSLGRIGGPEAKRLLMDSARSRIRKIREASEDALDQIYKTESIVT